MRRLVEYRLGVENEGTVLVEVEEPVNEASGEEEAASRSWRQPVEASVSLEEALERVRPAADTLLAKLRQLAVAPDETQIAFGIKLTASAGAVLASASVEANYTVTLTWKNDLAIEQASPSA